MTVIIKVMIMVIKALTLNNHYKLKIPQRGIKAPIFNNLNKLKKPKDLSNKTYQITTHNAQKRTQIHKRIEFNN